MIVRMTSNDRPNDAKGVYIGRRGRRVRDARKVPDAKKNLSSFVVMHSVPSFVLSYLAAREFHPAHIDVVSWRWNERS